MLNNRLYNSTPYNNLSRYRSLVRVFSFPVSPFVVPVKVRAWFNCPRSNGVAIEQGDSPTLRLGSSLVEFSDRPLSDRQTGAPV